jgi:hypothetical protein
LERAQVIRAALDVKVPALHVCNRLVVDGATNIKEGLRLRRCGGRRIAGCEEDKKEIHVLLWDIGMSACSVLHTQKQARPRTTQPPLSFSLDRRNPRQAGI